jgi:mono/diheme cytochrome c family protein
MTGWRLALGAGGLSFACAALVVQAQNAASEQANPQPGNFEAASLFAATCGFCHQDGGRSPGRGPKLAGTDKSDDYIIKQIKDGKPPGMPAFGGVFDDEQIRAIVAYIRGLKDTP